MLHALPFTTFGEIAALGLKAAVYCSRCYEHRPIDASPRPLSRDGPIPQKPDGLATWSYEFFVLNAKIRDILLLGKATWERLPSVLGKNALRELSRLLEVPVAEIVDCRAQE